MQIRCDIDVALIAPGGEWTTVRRMRNTVLYSGYNLLAGMIGTERYINGMYLEYRNGTPAEPVIQKSRNRSYYETLPPDQGYVRIAALAEPEYQSSDPLYTGNIAVFQAVTDGTFSHGAPLLDGNSQFFCVSLVSMPDAADRFQDSVYNAAPIRQSGVFAPVMKVANTQVGIRARLRFFDEDSLTSSSST